jgi:Fe2+ or Zn2+ uptake regulation protein
VGLTPTIQRLAVLESLEKTRSHPTADQILESVRKKFPTVSRATVYNTLEALTQAGLILRITVDPSVSRYDADLGPHAHFRCRVCNTVYDVCVEDENTLGDQIEGHRIETVRTYAYGICSECLAKEGSHAGAS